MVNYDKNSPKEQQYADYQQKKFVEFLMKLATKNPEALLKDFAPLVGSSLDGMRIDPDERITAEEGIKFFKNLGSLQKLVRNSKTLDEQQLDKLFARIKECLEFVYKVRNSIFHGSSILGVTVGPDQNNRIEVYHTFLRCLLSSFFSLAKTMFDNGKTE